MTRLLAVAVLFVGTVATADVSVEVDAQDVASNLGALYTTAGGVTKRTLQPNIDQLLASVRRLNSIAARLRDVNPSIRVPAMQYRALGWLHGWAALGAILSASRGFITDDQRWQLLDMEKPSALYLLLDTYGAIQRSAAESGVTGVKPLLAGPGPDCDRCLEMAYQQPILRTDGLPQADGRYYIPSTADLLGHPTDRAEAHRNLVSLWSLINLETDDWQTFDAKQNLFSSSLSIVKWLRGWEASQVLKNVDPGDTLVPRIARIRAFFEFRTVISNADILRDTVSLLKGARVSGSKYQFSNPSNDAERAIDRLRFAATPIEGERLYDASVWIRHLFLLSYDDEGMAIVVGARGISAEWPKFSPSDGGFTDHLAPVAKTVIAPLGSVLRWNQPPAQDSFSRAIADLTQTTVSFIQVQKARMDAEPMRLQSQHLKEFRLTYAVALRKQVAALDHILSLINPYFVGRSIAAFATDAPLWLVPAQTGWQRTATSREQGALAADLASLANLARQTQEISRLAAESCDSKVDDDTTAVFKALARTTSLHSWDITALPTEAFGYYDKRAEDALKAIRAGTAGADEAASLTRDFRARLAVFQDAEAGLKIGTIGANFAASVQKLAETELQIARIDGEINALRTDIARRRIDKANEEAEAASLTIKQAMRLNELAIAEVQALNAAFAQAQDVVASAISDLDSARRQLLESAHDIRSQNNRNAIFNIIKTVITITGVAIAPFTGGASLVAAQIAVGITDIIKVSTDKTRWKDFNSTVGTITELVDTGAQVVATGVNAWGSEKQKKNFDSFRKHLSAGLKQTNVTLQIAKQLYDGLQQKADFWKIATLLASGFPVRFKNNELVIDLATETVQLKVPSVFQDALTSALEAGARIQQLKTDVQQSAASFHAFIDRSLTQLDPDVLAKAMGRTAKEYSDNFDAAKKRLLLVYDALPPADQEQVSRLLGLVSQRGMVLVRTATGSIAALQRKYVEELQGLDDEIKLLQQDVVRGKIGQIVARVQQEERTLSDKSAAASNDPDRLEGVAKNDVPAGIERVKDALQDLQGEIARAQREAKTRQENLDISTYLGNAAYLNRDIVRTESDVVDAEVQKSNSALQAALEKRGQAELRRQMSDIERDRSERRVAAAQADLLFAYQKALVHGVDPTDGSFKEPPAGVRKILRLAVPPEHQDMIRSAGEGIFGMIQWLSLLKPTWRDSTSATSPLSYYAELVDAMASIGRGDGAIAAETRLTRLRSAIEATYHDLAATAPSATLCANPKVSSASLKWSPQPVNGEWVARFSYRLFVGDPRPLPASFINQKEVGHDGRWVFARLKPATMENVYLLMKVPSTRLDDPTEFSYRVTPPMQGRASRDSLSPSSNSVASTTPFATVRSDIKQVIFEANTFSTVFGPNLMQRPYLLPADGDWTLELHAPGTRARSWVADPDRVFALEMYCVEINQF